MRNRMRFLELGAGVVLAVTAGVLWGITEPTLSLPAVLKSVAWTVGVVTAWILAWAGIWHHEAQQQDLKKRLKRIDWSGS